MEHKRFAGTQRQQLEDDNVSDQIVHCDSSSVLERHLIRQLVDVFSWNGTQFSPCTELGQSNDTISNLQPERNERKENLLRCYRTRKNLQLTLKSSTPSPTASTSPAHSKPRIVGVFGGESIAPNRTIKSWKFKPL